MKQNKDPNSKTNTTMKGKSKANHKACNLDKTRQFNTLSQSLIGPN